MEKGENVQTGAGDAVSVGLVFKREKVSLLSRFTVDRTVEFLWAKKQSGSTHRGLYVGTDFGSF